MGQYHPSIPFLVKSDNLIVDATDLLSIQTTAKCSGGSPINQLFIKTNVACEKPVSSMDNLLPGTPRTIAQIICIGRTF